MAHGEGGEVRWCVVREVRATDPWEAGGSRAAPQCQCARAGAGVLEPWRSEAVPKA